MFKCSVTNNYRSFIESRHSKEKVGVLNVMTMLNEEIIEILSLDKSHVKLLQHTVTMVTYITRSQR